MKFKSNLLILRLKEEVDGLFGSRKEIKYEDLTKLKYLGMCILETLRLWPPGIFYNVFFNICINLKAKKYPKSPVLKFKISLIKYFLIKI